MKTIIYYSIRLLAFLPALMLGVPDSVGQTARWMHHYGSTTANERGIAVATDSSGDVFVYGTSSIQPVSFGNGIMISQSGRFLGRADSLASFQWVRSYPNVLWHRPFEVDAAGNSYQTGYINGPTQIDGISVTTGGQNRAFFVSKHDPNGMAIWVASIPGAEQGMAMAVDDSGYVYVGGAYDPAITVAGTSWPAATGTFPNAFVVKYSPQGTAVWSQSLRASGNPSNHRVWIHGLSVDPNGDVYITGRFHQTLHVGSQTFNGLGTQGEIYITKITKNGGFAWTKHGKGSGNDFGNDIACSEDGTIYVVGGYGADLSLDTYPLANNSNAEEAFFVRLDTAGQLLWETSIYSSGFAGLLSISVPSAERLYVTGSFSGSSLWTDTLFSSLDPSLPGKCLICRFDSSGHIVWTKAIESTTTSVLTQDIVGDQGNRVYVMGRIFGIANLDTFSVSSPNSGDILIACLIDSFVEVSPIVSPDSVWPGDSNQDGMANVYDLLPVGAFQGGTGLARPNPATNWAPQASFDWQLLNPVGNDLKHIDTDGDGDISVVDSIAIALNYGNIHGVPDSSAYQIDSMGVPLSLLFDQDSARVGDTISASLFVSAGTPEVMHGLALEIEFDTSLFVHSTADFMTDSSWLGQVGTDLWMMKRSNPAGILSLALSRFDQLNKHPNGWFANISWVLQDTLNPLPQWFAPRFVGAQMLDSAGTSIPVFYQADSIQILPPPFPQDSVWPGDVNLDGIANIHDFLPIGLYQGEMGAQRADASINWTPQAAYDWGLAFQQSINMKHVDTDGDGLISANDTLALNQNFTLMHDSLSAMYDSDPTGILLTVQFDQDSAYGGDSLYASILLDMDSLHGLAWHINYDPLMSAMPVQVEASDNTWLGQGMEVWIMEKHLLANESHVFAMTRTDQQGQSGTGEIARMLWKLPDSIPGGLPRWFVPKLQEASALKSDGTPIRFRFKQDSVWIDRLPSMDLSVIEGKHLLLFPNPANESVQLVAPESYGIFSWELYDIRGRRMSRTFDHQGTVRIPLHAYPEGIYMLRVLVEQSYWIERKLLIRH
ncbi:MAG: T9SS type A sorting domain-containing protein [Bacteroidota bacterium]